jgi:aryl-alcohol dehydrogenase-like predicted oxidoreductase
VRICLGNFHATTEGAERRSAAMKHRIDGESGIVSQRHRNSRLRAPGAPIEEAVGTMAGLVAAGEVCYLGRWEASVDVVCRYGAAPPQVALSAGERRLDRSVSRDTAPWAG